MSTDTQSSDGDEPLTEAQLQARVEELEDKVATLETDVGDDQKKMTIVATKGSFDMAYPRLILASTAAAFGWEVVVFHTFWGLDILHEDNSKNLQLSGGRQPEHADAERARRAPGDGPHGDEDDAEEDRRERQWPASRNSSNCHSTKASNSRRAR